MVYSTADYYIVPCKVLHGYVAEMAAYRKQAKHDVQIQYFQLIAVDIGWSRTPLFSVI